MHVLVRPEVETGDPLLGVRPTGGPVPDDAPSPRRQRSNENDKKLAREFGLGYQLAFEFVGYLLVCGLAGRWLDQARGWNGRGLFIGLLVAMGAWIYRVLRTTRGLFK